MIIRSLLPRPTVSESEAAFLCPPPPAREAQPPGGPGDWQRLVPGRLGVLSRLLRARLRTVFGNFSAASWQVPSGAAWPPGSEATVPLNGSRLPAH
eukprot:213427-Hanusia_phi.AAC.2